MVAALRKAREGLSSLDLLGEEGCPRRIGEGLRGAWKSLRTATCCSGAEQRPRALWGPLHYVPFPGSFPSPPFGCSPRCMPADLCTVANLLVRPVQRSTHVGLSCRKSGLLKKMSCTQADPCRVDQLPCPGPGGKAEGRAAGGIPVYRAWLQTGWQAGIPRRGSMCGLFDSRRTS